MALDSLQSPLDARTKQGSAGGDPPSGLPPEVLRMIVASVADGTPAGLHALQQLSRSTHTFRELALEQWGQAPKRCLADLAFRLPQHAYAALSAVSPRDEQLSAPEKKHISSYLMHMRKVVIDLDSSTDALLLDQFLHWNLTKPWFSRNHHLVLFASTLEECPRYLHHLFTSTICKLDLLLSGTASAFSLDTMSGCLDAVKSTLKGMTYKFSDYDSAVFAAIRKTTELKSFACCSSGAELRAELEERDAIPALANAVPDCCDTLKIVRPRRFYPYFGPRKYHYPVGMAFLGIRTLMVGICPLEEVVSVMEAIHVPVLRHLTLLVLNGHVETGQGFNMSLLSRLSVTIGAKGSRLESLGIAIRFLSHQIKAVVERQPDHFLSPLTACTRLRTFSLGLAANKEEYTFPVTRDTLVSLLQAWAATLSYFSLSSTHLSVREPSFQAYLNPRILSDFALHAPNLARLQLPIRVEDLGNWDTSAIQPVPGRARPALCFEVRRDRYLLRPLAYARTTAEGKHGAVVIRATLAAILAPHLDRLWLEPGGAAELFGPSAAAENATPVQQRWQELEKIITISEPGRPMRSRLLSPESLTTAEEDDEDEAQVRA
ncbi:hypothetical protein CALCODRAFT_536825 [Calocera cornea HHB12733]|uniref:Uncharacterized protein n=1 Tax=Calocera cornea HHB12733 TaxID=1353952 RepID=A0A165C7A8_9BASI|nr:hypothetical protein CALCODRAFT_536825 [Calocera cornea HHB12733]